MKIGDIAYWYERNLYGGFKHDINYGIITDIDHGIAYIDLLLPKETRKIDGIPIDDYKSPSEWKKLPKGWTWNTRLYHLTWDLIPELKDIHIENPNEIKKAIRDGLMVSADKIFSGKIETEITRDGYRIVLKYPMWEKQHQKHTSMQFQKLHAAYDDAKQELIREEEELKRQASLSDAEWSIEQIDKTLERYKVLYDATENEIAAYRKWLLSLDNIEDVVARISCEGLQWRYDKNKRWNNIVI